MSQDMLDRGRARLVTAACLGVAAAVVFIIGYWILSGSLEDWETLVAGAVFILLLGGDAWLARTGRVMLAAWLLVGLLTLIVSIDLVEYGIGSPTAAAYVIPIALAACCLGFWEGLSIAVTGSAVCWLVAWASTSGRLDLDPPADISHLTFNAPALTVILLITVLIVGWWSSYLTKPRAE
jgi:hypothetical protein